jgi:hypothetical protein
MARTRRSRLHLVGETDDLIRGDFGPDDDSPFREPIEKDHTGSSAEEESSESDSEGDDAGEGD